ncbi:MAG: hypothetical protein ACFFB3_07725, partial [Candidatus Hodarchaeota archaeon]
PTIETMSFNRSGFSVFIVMVLHLMITGLANLSCSTIPLKGTNIVLCPPKRHEYSLVFAHSLIKIPLLGKKTNQVSR